MPRPIPELRSYDVTFCQSKACVRGGSKQILKFVQDLSIQQIRVTGGGCLGGCGKGPNVVIQEHRGDRPADPVLVGHVATPSDAAEMLQIVCGVGVSYTDVISVQARLHGNQMAQEGQLEAALAKYNEGIALQPGHGLHLLYCNRSAVLLQLGRKEEALQDALVSLESGTPGFTKSWLRVIDSLYALGRYNEAAAMARKALQECEGFGNIPEFKDIREALRRAGTPI